MAVVELALEPALGLSPLGVLGLGRLRGGGPDGGLLGGLIGGLGAAAALDVSGSETGSGALASDATDAALTASALAGAGSEAFGSSLSFLGPLPQSLGQTQCG